MSGPNVAVCAWICLEIGTVVRLWPLYVSPKIEINRPLRFGWALLWQDWWKGGWEGPRVKVQCGHKIPTRSEEPAERCHWWKMAMARVKVGKFCAAIKSPPNIFSPTKCIISGPGATTLNCRARTHIPCIPCCCRYLSGQGDIPIAATPARLKSVTVEIT